jgi:transcriptional regulator with XRE-family HTH domain
MKRLREERNLSTRQVARLSGVSNAYISQIENNERGIPSPKILDKLAPVYKVDYGYLMELAGHIKHIDKAKQTNEVGDTFVDYDPDTINYAMAIIKQAIKGLTPEEAKRRINQMLITLRVIDEIENNKKSDS